MSSTIAEGIQRTFVDANVLVYAYDLNAEGKHDIAERLMADLWQSRQGVLSSQVLQEFYVNVTRKIPLPLDRPIARGIIRTLGAWPTRAIVVEDIVAASELEQRHRLSFWDALVVIAAQRLGARVLATEDLQAGRRFGDLVVHDPFASR